MKFRTTEELLNFMNNIDLEESVLVFKKEIATEDAQTCGCESKTDVCACDSETVTEASNISIGADQIIVESFTDSPQFKLVVTDDQANTFFVKEYHAIEDACGTGSITLTDREAKMNMCEMDGVATVTLDIITDGHKLKSVPFILAKTDDAPFLQLSKTRLV